MEITEVVYSEQYLLQKRFISGKRNYKIRRSYIYIYMDIEERAKKKHNGVVQILYVIGSNKLSFTQILFKKSASSRKIVSAILS